jgi:hypothetical protein
MKSWNLNFLEPSGLLQACNGVALPLPFTLHLRDLSSGTAVNMNLHVHDSQSSSRAFIPGPPTYKARRYALDGGVRLFSVSTQWSYVRYVPVDICNVHKHREAYFIYPALYSETTLRHSSVCPVPTGQL